MVCPRYAQLLVRPIPVKPSSVHKRGRLPVCNVNAILVIVTVNVYGVANCLCCQGRRKRLSSLFTGLNRYYSTIPLANKTIVEYTLRQNYCILRFYITYHHISYSTKDRYVEVMISLSTLLDSHRKHRNADSFARG